MDVCAGVVAAAARARDESPDDQPAGVQRGHQARGHQVGDCGGDDDDDDDDDDDGDDDDGQVHAQGARGDGDEV